MVLRFIELVEKILRGSVKDCHVTNLTFCNNSSLGFILEIELNESFLITSDFFDDINKFLVNEFAELKRFSITKNMLTLTIIFK